MQAPTNFNEQRQLAPFVCINTHKHWNFKIEMEKEKNKKKMKVTTPALCMMRFGSTRKAWTSHPLGNEFQKITIITIIKKSEFVLLFCDEVFDWGSPRRRPQTTRKKPSLSH